MRYRHLRGKREAIVRISADGRITIPAKMRERFAMRPGSAVVLTETPKGIMLRDIIEATYGMLKGCGVSTADLLADRAEDLAIEERQYQRHVRRARAAAARRGRKPV